MRTILIVVGAAFGLTVQTAQQAPPSPVPAGAPAASIRGTVTDTKGAPVANASVVLFPADPSRWSGPASAGVLQRALVAAGRFLIPNLPAGDYRLAVEADAALGSWPAEELIRRLQSARPFPVQLSAGEQVTVNLVVAIGADGITVQAADVSRLELRTGGTPALPAGRGRPAGPARPTAPGAISGRVVDVDLRPVEGVIVRSLRRIERDGIVQPATFGSETTTDASGRYTLTNRAAADYLVVAMTYSLDLGSGTTVRRAPPATRGPDGRMLADVVTFYGNKTSERDASTVSVATSEVTGIDIQLARVPVFDLTGTVTGLVPSPGRSSLIVAPARVGDQLSGANVRRAALGTDGRFTIDDLAAGSYRLSFTASSGWGETSVTVTDRSPDPIIIPARPPVTLTGRVEFRGSTPAPDATALANLLQFGVELAPAVITVGAGFSRTPISASGAFTASGVGPGPFKLRAVAPPPWVQVAGFVSGVDTLDLPGAIGGSPTDAVVVFSDHPSAIRVEVRDAAGAAVVGATVVVFMDDPRYWDAPSRRLQSAQTQPGGACSLSGLPPGRYRMFATRSITVGQPMVRTTLERENAMADSFDLDAGESKSIQIRIR